MSKQLLDLRSYYSMPEFNRECIQDEEEIRKRPAPRLCSVFAQVIWSAHKLLTKTPHKEFSAEGKIFARRGFLGAAELYFG